MATLDETKAVREGEELDLERLEHYLAEVLGGTHQVAVTQFPSGHSNLTYLVRWGDRDYVLRRPPFGSKVKTAHDMGREFRVLSVLSPAYPKAPRPVAFCEDESVVGARFYLMEPVPGIILRKQPPADVEIAPATATRLSEALADTLAELHGVDYAAIGLGDFGKPAGYVERQVTGWTDRYHGSQTDDIPQMAAVARWLAQHMPVSGAPALIHNDFKFDNVVLAPEDITRVVGILDWEMATVGDPLMDLGSALSYWVEATDPQPLQMTRFGPTTLPGMLTRRQFADRYAEASGRDLRHILFYYCFGLFKLAVIAQQIYYRYAQGLTRDPRFAQLIFAVKVLAEQAAAAIDRDGM